MTDLAEQLPPKRPVLVWVICIPMFICTPFMLLSLVVTLLMTLGAIPIPESQRQLMEAENYFERSVAILNDVMVPAWAVLLFQLRRQSFYVYTAMLVNKEPRRKRRGINPHEIKRNSDNSKFCHRRVDFEGWPTVSRVLRHYYDTQFGHFLL